MKSGSAFQSTAEHQQLIQCIAARKCRPVMSELAMSLGLANVHAAGVLPRPVSSELIPPAEHASSGHKLSSATSTDREDVRQSARFRCRSRCVRPHQCLHSTRSSEHQLQRCKQEQDLCSIGGAPRRIASAGKESSSARHCQTLRPNKSEKLEQLDCSAHC